MQVNTNSNLPSFFYNNVEDEFKTDQGYETLQDFYLAWTIHCADDKFKNINPKLHEYARRADFGLIYGCNDENDNFKLDKKPNDSFRIISVETWRQWKKIDLLAEIFIEEGSISKSFVLNIENKWYSALGNTQLEVYRQHVENEFSGKENKIINLFITCDDVRSNYEVEKETCRKHHYSFLTIADINRIAEMNELTGNALFDEYWFGA